MGSRLLTFNSENVSVEEGMSNESDVRRYGPLSEMFWVYSW